MQERRAVRMVCKECGSEDVMCDAYAEWNFEKQEWDVGSVYDKGSYCRDCDGECRIIEQDANAEEEC